MAFDDAAVMDLFDRVQSHAMSLGLFERVNRHEPKSAPGNGLTCSIWLQDISPVRSSGLSATSGKVTFHIRVMNPMLQEPQDDIDPGILKAINTLLAAYSGDFDLGATVRNIDLLGMAGTALSAQAGYLSMDNRVYRVMVITMPVIINDLWQQAG